MISPISRMQISNRPGSAFLKACVAGDGVITRPMPNISAKNTMPSFCLSSAAAAMMLCGTMPISRSMKLSSAPLLAMSPAFSAPACIAAFSVAGSRCAPGCSRLTISTPMPTAMPVTLAV